MFGELMTWNPWSQVPYIISNTWNFLINFMIFVHKQYIVIWDTNLVKRFSKVKFDHLYKRLEIICNEIQIIVMRFIYLTFLNFIRNGIIFFFLQTRCRPRRFSPSELLRWSRRGKMPLGGWLHHERSQAHGKGFQMVALQCFVLPSFLKVWPKLYLYHLPSLAWVYYISKKSYRKKSFWLVMSFI